jgi:hypothetical protein
MRDLMLLPGREYSSDTIHWRGHMGPRTLLYLALASICLGFSHRDALCQDNQATPNFSGMITDLTGAPIAGAHIWIYEEHGEPSFTVQSDRSGSFTIQLPSGHYDVMIGSADFLPFCKLISLQPGKPIKLQVGLRVDPDRLEVD